MTWTSQRLELFVLSCLVLTSHTSEVLPPQNVSLRWITSFEPQLSWAPPRHPVENCSYEVEWSRTNQTDDRYTCIPKNLTWSEYTVMDGRHLYLAVRTICNDTHSEPVELPVIYPELVRNLSCYIHSSNLTRCSWHRVSDIADFGFFFRLTAEDLSASINNKSNPNLQACPEYVGGRTGCNLQAKPTHAIHILFNGTLNNRLVRNTFKIWLKENVRPLPLTWTAIKAGDKFNISWIPPDFCELSCWTFKIRQTACNKSLHHDKFHVTSTELNVVPHCKNCMAIKVERSRAKEAGRESEWSEEKCFAGEPNALVYAAIIIPLMFAVLATLTLVCCKKNKDVIFPRVPEPRDFLSDISDNNNKITVRNLYIPAEEEDCKITLVIDPLNNKLLS
ncbi:uncharacterized protein LOC119027565 [Acanthopagrus latus]|uniref:uncharacterized protein LOC119027565 n=1 Tax=Acanthopagrus latus TaxID=8177 RepID=UPI00187C88FF|nr:uncharacterized protein LOC119027565 [Acanthopagrus latus]